MKIILIILKDLGTNLPQKREGNQSTNNVLGNVRTWDTTVLKNSIQKFEYNPVINKPSQGPINIKVQKLKVKNGRYEISNIKQGLKVHCTASRLQA